MRVRLEDHLAQLFAVAECALPEHPNAAGNDYLRRVAVHEPIVFNRLEAIRKVERPRISLPYSQLFRRLLYPRRNPQVLNRGRPEAQEIELLDGLVQPEVSERTTVSEGHLPDSRQRGRSLEGLQFTAEEGQVPDLF